MYQIDKIASIIGAQFLNQLHFDAQIAHLHIDSRRLSFPKTALFFALKGERRNGHDFLQTAYQAGIRNFVVQTIDKINLSDFQDANILQVPDVLTALQQLATYHQKQFPSLHKIAITGSNGKTIVKEWLYQLLKSEHDVVRSPKSYNSQVGVSLSIWQIESRHDIGLFEMGISKPNEMARLEAIVEPNIGILTNIGEAHDEGFKSRLEKIEEKLLAFKSCNTILCNAEQLTTDTLAVLAKNATKNQEIITWSIVDSIKYNSKRPKSNTTPTWQISLIKKAKTTTLSSKFLGRKIPELTIPFTDTASIDNAITCCLTLKRLGYGWKSIATKVLNLEPIEMRLQLKDGINNCLLVNDFYNSDLTSLTMSLDFMVQQSSNLKRTLVLSDILQTGIPAPKLYREVADLIQEKGISKIIAIGTEITKLGSFLAPTGHNINAQFIHFKTTEDFLLQLNIQDFQNEIILLKGARSFSYERIAERLSLKAHKTVLEIDLAAMINNLYVYSRILNSDTKLMAMVKASAYGNGADEVTRLLEHHNVDYLAVAYSDEGVELRNAGIKLPIMVLNPEVSSFETMIRQNLEPEIYSMNLLKQLLNGFPKSNANNHQLVIHLKIDTGMHRLGFEAQDISQLCILLNEHPDVKVKSIFSHLASSEDAKDDVFTEEQITKFNELYAQISKSIGYSPLRHILNSSGITRFPQHQMDMVRLGIGLYGVDSSALMQGHLEVVQTLKATISQIKKVLKGDSVGYNRRGKVEHDMRIATISIGYADGLDRKAGYGNHSVALHGKRAPIVGTICMDMCMIDVTNIPEAQEGDIVEIFGKELPVQELAKTLGTIPYEIFTTISNRVKRVYYN
jgi:Alr-MurF fusion protein